MSKSYMEILEKRGIHPFIGENGQKSLKEFDPKIQYAMKEKTGPAFKSPHLHVLEIGKNSNLISDMCWYGATSEELVRAIKHGMVLFDAEEHFLDWRQSEKDNGIEELHKEYRRYHRCPKFTERERLVIAAYTGYVINGDDVGKITPFIEETLGHTIRTPEPPENPIIVEVHRAFKDEFCNICRRHHIFNI